MPARSFRDLIVWQRSIELSVAIYTLTKSFPREELFGLTSQMRRAAVSIPSNIAEGEGRATSGEFKQFLGVARGSNAELQTQLILVRRFAMAEAASLDRCESLSAEITRMLNALITPAPKP